MPDASPDCLFCNIISGKMPASIVFSNEDAAVIQDINPQAPVHLLVISRAHYRDVTQMETEAPALLARLIATAVEAARHGAITESGYRLVLNTGADGGQTVDHLHIHVLGGRHLSWPPG